MIHYFEDEHEHEHEQFSLSLTIIFPSLPKNWYWAFEREEQKKTVTKIHLYRKTRFGIKRIQESVEIKNGVCDSEIYRIVV